MKNSREKETEIQKDLSHNIEATKASYFVRLKEKWQLGSMLHLLLVLITFTIGGSACGFLTGKIMSLSSISLKSPFWWISYVVLASIIWPACVYIISFFFGQQKFFKKYLIKMGNRMFGKKEK